MPLYYVSSDTLLCGQVRFLNAVLVLSFQFMIIQINRINHNNKRTSIYES